MYRILFLILIAFSGTTQAASKTYFVSATGSDSNTGLTVDAPFGTITKAISATQPGDTIYVRGGTYAYSSTISISKSGTASAKYSLLAFPGERAVLDFSGTDFGKKGISLTGSYWHIKGFDVKLAGDNGMYISGGNNVIEFCSFSENKDSGMQLSGGAHDNQIINCDSYYNADPTDYGDADGFACKMDVGTNNSFYGCRSWYNVDDGWDGYMRGANDVSTTLENCWTWMNGYFKDGTDAGAAANGNGFKMGGSDDKTLMHNFTLKNCVSFYNKAKGFDQNNNKGSMILYNCTGYHNLVNNFSISQTLNTGKVLEAKNCVAVDNKVSLGSFAIQATNSWMTGFSVSTADFVSLDTTGVSGPRKADGSLPDVAFVHLASGSDLIDRGTDVGIPYKGNGPDLGAFESDFSTGTSNIPDAGKAFKAAFADQNLIIRFNSEPARPLKIQLFKINGQAVLSTEINQANQISEINCSQLNSGIYILKMSSGNEQWQPTKVVKIN